VLVGLARVALRVHYVSDVLVGAACGLICGIGLAAYVGF
jgi:membrane-associated phospholipid phosphatase